MTRGKNMTKMVKTVKLYLNFTRSQIMTVIWLPVSSASYIAVVLGLDRAAGVSRNRARCHIAGVNPTTSPFWCQTVTGSNNNFAATTTRDKCFKMRLLGKLLRIFPSFKEAHFGVNQDVCPVEQLLQEVLSLPPFFTYFSENPTPL